MPSESCLIVEQLAAPFEEMPELLRELASTHQLGSYDCRQLLLGRGQALLAKGNVKKLAGIQRLLNAYEIESHLFTPTRLRFAPFVLTRFEPHADRLVLFGRDKEMTIPHGAQLLILFADLSGHLIERSLSQFISSQRFRGTADHTPLPTANQQRFILQGKPVVDIYLLDPDGIPVAAARALPGKFDHRCLGERATLSVAQNLLKLIELVKEYAGRCRIDMNFGLSPLPDARLNQTGKDPLEELKLNLRNLTRYAWLQADIDRARIAKRHTLKPELAAATNVAFAAMHPGLAATPVAEQILTEVTKAEQEPPGERRSLRTPLKKMDDLPPPPEIKRHSIWLSPKTFGGIFIAVLFTLLSRTDQTGRLLGPFLKRGLESGSISALISLGLYYFAFKRLKLKRLIENTPTSKIRSLAMGMVEIKGTARRQYALVSPKSNVACIYYRLTRYRRDSKENWVVSSVTSSGQVPFWVEDETGRVSVNPDRAAVKPAHRQESFDDLSTALGGFADNDEKWVEELIYDGALVYVLGEAQIKKRATAPRAEKRAKRLRDLKRDPQRLAAFDKDGDGRIDEQEWQAARDAVEAELLHADLAASDIRRRQEDHVVIGRPRQAGLPFVVAETHSEEHLTGMHGWSIAIMLVFATLATGLSVLLLIRDWG